MYIHAYDNDLNYLGIKEVERVTVQVQEDFEQELLIKYPKAKIFFDCEPTDKELNKPFNENDDSPF